MDIAEGSRENEMVMEKKRKINFWMEVKQRYGKRQLIMIKQESTLTYSTVHDVP